KGAEWGMANGAKTRRAPVERLPIDAKDAHYTHPHHRTERRRGEDRPGVPVRERDQGEQHPEDVPGDPFRDVAHQALTEPACDDGGAKEEPCDEAEGRKQDHERTETEKRQADAGGEEEDTEEHNTHGMS